MSTRKIDITFEAEKLSKQFQIASGYISETAVLFEKEKVIAVIQAAGKVSFYSMENVLLATGEVPPVVNGKEVYQDICCRREEGKLLVQFPIYEWIDNYPHCDGEHDRWDTKTVGYHTLSFALATGAVACSEQ